MEELKEGELRMKKMVVEPKGCMLSQGCRGGMGVPQS